MAESLFRLRISFSKTGRLRWLSHLELTRAMERLVRRAALPYAISAGFSAHMRFAPGPALPVGTAGLAELFDVWLTDYVDGAAALNALRQVAPAGLAVLAVSYADPKARGLQATHILEDYRLEVATALPLADLRAALAALVASGQLEILHRGKPRCYDLNTALVGLSLPDSANAEPWQSSPGVSALDDPALLRKQTILLTLRNSNSGSLRPEYLLQAALPAGSFQVLSSTRTALRQPDAESGQQA